MRILTIDTQTEVWSKIYELSIEKDNCPKCGIERVANIPFAADKYRGLVSSLHECGEKYRLRVFRPIGSEINRWGK